MTSHSASEIDTALRGLFLLLLPVPHIAADLRRIQPHRIDTVPARPEVSKRVKPESCAVVFSSFREIQHHGTSPRFVIPGQPQHVIQRGNNRQVIFAADEDYRFFRDALVWAAADHRLAIPTFG